MRHAESQQEVTRQIGILGQQNCGRIAGEISAVANQVSLVVVASGKGSIGPIGWLLLQDTEDVVKKLQPAKQLGRETDLGFEAPLQLADAYAKLARQGAKIGGSARQGDAAHRFGDQSICFRFRGEEGGFRAGDRVRRIEGASQAARQRGREIFHRCKAPRLIPASARQTRRQPHADEIGFPAS